MKKILDLIDKTSFTDLLSVCVGKAYSNQLALQEYLGNYNRWDLDIVTGKLYIDEKEFDVNFIGTTATSDGMWFNADLEREIPIEYLKDLFLAYENIQKCELEALLPKKIKLDEIYTDHSLAFIYTTLVGRNTCYFKGNGDISIFMTFKELPEKIFSPIDANKFLKRSVDIVSSFNVNAKLMIKAFALSNNSKFEEEEDTIKVIFDENSKLSFKFDEKNRLINAKGEL